MQDVKGIIFDMDGVILDTERIYLEILEMNILLIMN